MLFLQCYWTNIYSTFLKIKLFNTWEQKSEEVIILEMFIFLLNSVCVFFLLLSLVKEYSNILDYTIKLLNFNQIFLSYPKSPTLYYSMYHCRFINYITMQCGISRCCPVSLKPESLILTLNDFMKLFFMHTNALKNKHWIINYIKPVLNTYYCYSMQLWNVHGK